MNLTPWEDDKVVTPWDSDPIAPQLRLVNPDAPWESDPEPATWWKTIKAIPKTTLGSTQQAIGGITQAIGDVTRADSVAEVGAGIAESGSRNIEEVHPGEMTYWQRAVLSGASSAAQQVPLIAATVVTGGLAAPLTGMAALAGGSTYAESRKKGSDISSSLGHAGIDAATEALFELIPLRFIRDAAAGPVLRLITGTLALEVPTEVATTAIQSVNARLRDRELTGQPIDWKEYGQDLLDTIGSTMVAAPMIGGAAGAIGRMGRRAETGTIIPDNPPQQFDQPTTPIDSAKSAEIDALISSLDAELIDDAAVLQAQETLKKHELARKTNPAAEAQWLGYASAPERLAEDAGELGASAKQAANAKNYVNPNTGDRMDRQFLYGPEGTEGLTMRAAEMKPATYTLGQPSEDRPADYLRAIHDTVEEWRQKYLPNATIVVSNENLFTDSALGSHYLIMPGQHLIVPAVLRSPSKGLGAFNANTQASAFYNLSHEFGHGIVKEKFLEGVAIETAAAVVRESEKGLVTEATIASLPEIQQAVIREYNAIKEAIGTNQMSAEQFVQTWLSPAKGQGRNFLGDLKLQPADNAMDVVKAIISRAAKRININDASKVREMQERLQKDFLSLDEYLAEQTARYAYKAQWDKTTPLGQFFKGALESLRKFFIGLKKDQQIAPGVAFTEWIEGLSKMDRQITEGKQIAEGKKKGKAPVKRAAGPSVKKVVSKLKVQKVQHNVETSTTGQKQMKGRQLAVELIRTGVLENTQSDQFKELLDYLKREDWTEFVDLYKRLAGKNVKLQLDPDARTSGHVGLKTDIKALIQLFGLNMYSGEVSDVIVKELVQNSFDAVKTMLYNKRTTEGNIIVTVNAEQNTITVKDDGVGMDKETLLKAFLTYPGTSKTDLPIEHRSGGLGQAKQLLLFTPESIRVESIKDGRLLILEATPQQLLDGTAVLNTESSDAPSGTTVTVVLPKTVEREGKLEEVKIGTYPWDYNVLSNPPLYPGITVKFNSPLSGGEEAIPSLLDTHKFFKKVEAAWGYVDVYIGGAKPGANSWTVKHRVMSAGAWQFNTSINLPDISKLPIDLIFDIHPTVEGQHSAYPFTPNRQELKKHSRDSLSKAVDSVVSEYYKELLRQHVAEYTKVKIVTPIPDNAPVGTQAQFSDPQFTVTEDENKVPVVTFTRGETSPAFYYNSTNKDFLAIPGAPEFIGKLVTIQQDFVKHYTNNHDAKGNLYSVGIGFDRGAGKNKNPSGWGGLHFRRPYHSLWLNPVYSDIAIDPSSAAASATHVLMHEAMHINIQDHNASAFWEMSMMYTNLDSTQYLSEIKARFENVFNQHWDTYVAIKQQYDADDTKTVGTAIKGDQGAQRDIDDAERSLSDVRTGEELASSFDDTRGPWRNTSFELDISDHPGQSKFDKLRNFFLDYPRLRRGLRQAANSVYHLVELQQLTQLNPDIDGLAFMNEQNGEYNRYKSRLQAQADQVLNEWSNLGKDNFTKLEKFIRAEVESKQLWFDLTKTQVVRDKRNRTWYEYIPNATTALKAQELGLDENLVELALSVKNVLLSQLNEAEFALQDLLAKRYANSGQDVLIAAMVPVARHIHELRKSPFFPEGRFGNRMLIVEKKKATGAGYDIVWRENFEDPIEWEKAWKKAVLKAAPDERVRKEHLSDQSYVLMALPTDFVDMAASELGLSDEQLDVLMNILQPVKRDKVLGAYDQQRLGIKGYSADTMRSFANFTWHNSNLLAKLIYRAQFNSAIRSVGVKLREAKYSQDAESLAQVSRLEHIKSYMEKARDYIMAPPNEAQMLRATVSIAYLGLNVKTALLNTYGLVTTWSDLTTRLGQLEGNKLFLKASLGTFRSLKLTNLNERREGNYLPQEKQKALDQAIKEGVLSQSYAYHLAGMANAGTLWKMPARQLAGKIGQGAIDVAMYAFRLTELSTRRASFLSEFELARKNTKVSFEEAYQEAVRKTNLLQNDYSLGNRVPFMRGFKIDKNNPLGKLVEPVIPLATVFMSFAQHMAFHTYGGYELGEHRMAKQLGETPRTILGGYTMKIWIVTLLLAGYEGLPGAENLLDLLETAWRKWGGAKPVRQEIREMIQALEIDPQLASRGFGHNLAGFDLSRSIGFGRLVPGTDALAHPRDSMAEQLGTLVLDAAGPTGGFIKFGLDAMDSKKNKADTFEKLPGGMGNIYTAYHWSQQGVLAPSRAKITFDLASGELRDLTTDEIFGKAMGFNPTIVSQNREIRFNQYDRQVYWQTRRTMLVQDLWRAREQRDKEAEADAKKAITEYNLGVPSEYKALRLTGADIMSGLQARAKMKKMDESKTTARRKYRPLYQDVRESYDSP